MALTYNQLTGITRKKFIPKLVDNIFDSNALLQRAKKKWYEKLDGGERIMVPLEYAKLTASGWYSGADTLSTTDNDSITAAEYLWRQLYVNISIRRDEELKNMGDSQAVNLVKGKVKGAEKQMADLLGIGLYNNGTTTDAIVGLRDIVATDQTVGGISQTTNSWWQGQVDSSTTVLTIAAMQAQFEAASIGNDRPSIIAATRSNYNRYYALLQPQQRFQSEETAKGGFSSLMFNSVPIVSDANCPTSHMFMLNEKYIRFYAHKSEDFRMTDFESPVNQNVKTAKLFWMGALGSSNNRMHAALTAVTG